MTNSKRPEKAKTNSKARGPFARFAYGVGDFISEYNEVRSEARRRFPTAFM